MVTKPILLVLRPKSLSGIRAGTPGQLTPSLHKVPRALKDERPANRRIRAAAASGEGAPALSVAGRGRRLRLLVGVV